jgi:hypothetical protein
MCCVSGLGAFQAEAVHAARPYVKVHSVSESNESRPTADDTAGSYSWDTVRWRLEAKSVEVQLVADKYVSTPVLQPTCQWRNA